MKRTLFLQLGLCVLVLNLGQAADPAVPATAPAANAPSDQSVQPTSPSEVTQLDPIVVTATRTEAPASKSTAAMTVIDRKQIEDNQYQTVVEALQDVPGLHLAQSSTPGQTIGVFMRGTNSNHTSILVDGRPLPADLAGAYDLTDLSLDNVERIEVVRGPSSTLYGANAIGGVINIITQDGRGLEKPVTSVSAESGSFNTFREAVSSRGAVGPFDYSASVSRWDTTFQRYNNDYNSDHADAKLGYQINSDVYSDLSFDYRLINNQNPGSIYSASLPTDYGVLENWRISPGTTWQTTDIWKQHVYYTHDSERYVAMGNLPGTFSPNSRVQIDTDEIDYQSDVQVFKPWLVTAGLTTSNSLTYQVSDQPNDGVSPPSETYHNAQTNTGVYLQSQWDILENWKWTQAVRFQHFSDYGEDFTWSTGTNYQVPGTKTILRANYATAFAPPAEQNFLTFGGSQIINPNLQPERSKGYDFGVEQPFFEKKVSVSATYFRNDIRDLIQAIGFPDTPINLNEAKTYGVELAGQWQICDPLSVAVDYTYLDATTDYDLTTGLVGPDVRLIRRPRDTIDVNFTAHPIKAVTLTWGASWIMQEQDVNASFVQVRVPDYFTARATVAWDINQNWEVFGRVENLTNDKYQEVAGYPTLDQAFYGGFKFTF